MTAKRFKWVFIRNNELELRDNVIVKRFNNERLEELLNELHEENKLLLRKNGAVEEEIECLSEENEQLKEENNKLHQKIFEMRTNIALERTEISKQTYTGKKISKEYLTAIEFLDEIEKW